MRVDRPRPRASLRLQLLAWLLIPLLFVVAFNAYTTYANARLTASTITDRLLLAAARVLAEQVQVEDGRVEALILPSALGIFASVGQDRALYAIMDPDGRLIAGYPDVPAPPRAPTQVQPVYFASRFRTQEVRAVALLQPLPAWRPGAAATIVVGETLRGEDLIVAELWRQGALQQVALVLFAAGLAWLGLERGLSPLIALRDHVRDRDPEALTPLEAGLAPRELEPVVAALNEAAARVRRQVGLQRRFIDDAAHQLRTPLTVLKTQASVGRRTADIAAKDEALDAIDAATDRLARMANQLLALARAEPGGAAPQRELADLAQIARKVLDQRAGRALDRQIDLGLEAAPAPVLGDPAMLAELIANLLDNALAYTPPGGRITVHVGPAGDGGALLRVEDNGPGIPESERERVFERFHRVLGNGVEGSGLGLSIVREIARAHGASVRLAAPPQGRGLWAETRFPRPVKE